MWIPVPLSCWNYNYIMLLIYSNNTHKWLACCYELLPYCRCKKERGQNYLVCSITTNYIQNLQYKPTIRRPSSFTAVLKQVVAEESLKHNEMRSLDNKQVNIRSRHYSKSFRLKYITYRNSVILQKAFSPRMLFLKLNKIAFMIHSQ